MTVPERTANRELLLTEGGPTYRIEKRLGLMRENSPRIIRRALFSVCLTWLVLLGLAAFQGFAVGHKIPVPFLGDFAVHARFILAVPLLLLAETVLGPRLADAADHFVSSGVVVEQDFSKFDSAVARGLALRDSTMAEVIFVALAYAASAFAVWSTSVHVSTWSVLRTGSGFALTWAGWWLMLFCIPLFHFLTIRWLWRLFLWAQFLWRMSRLNLQLMPTHPDEAGGLGFVGEAQRYFGIILVAYSFTVAGVLANTVLYDKVPLPQLALEIATYTFCAVVFVLIPVVVFVPNLFETKIEGMSRYGTLATEYTQSFHQKWILGRRTASEPLLGSGDIQSLADLGNSFSFVDKMKLVPLGSREPIHLALASVLPMSPLLLTVMPLNDILKLLFKAVL
jgi:hypothetical protein